MDEAKIRPRVDTISSRVKEVKYYLFGDFRPLYVPNKSIKLRYRDPIESNTSPYILATGMPSVREGEIGYIKSL